MSKLTTKTNVKSTIGDAVMATAITETTPSEKQIVNALLDVSIPQPVIAMDTLYTDEAAIEAACLAAQTDTKANLLAWQRIVLSGINHYVTHRNVNVLVNIVLKFPRVYGLNGLLNYLETYAPVSIETVQRQLQDENGTPRVNKKGEPVMGAFDVPVADTEKLRSMTETPEAQALTLDNASRNTWWGKQVKKLPPYRSTNIYSQGMALLNADAKRLKSALDGDKPLQKGDYLTADHLLKFKAFLDSIKPLESADTTNDEQIIVAA